MHRVHLSFFRLSYIILLTSWEAVQLEEKSKMYCLTINHEYDLAADEQNVHN